MKVEVKWIDDECEWRAFFPDRTLHSAGVTDIVDQVNEALPDPEPGYVWKWESDGTKLVVRQVPAGKTKMSKSDRT